MRKFLLIFSILPFSLFGEINPSDLSKLEGLVTDIYGQQQDIKNEVTSADNHLQYIRQMVYDILTEIDNADLDGNLSNISGNLSTAVVRLGVLKDTLTTLQNVIGEKIDVANNFLFDLKVGLLDFQNLFDTFKTNLEKYNLQLYNTLNNSLYNIEEYLYSINQSLLSIEANVSLITQNTQNIYTELLKMGYDVRTITEYTGSINSNVNEIWGNTDTIIDLLRSMQNSSFSVGSYKLPNFTSYYYRDINRVDKFLGDSVSLTLPSSTNFYDSVISRLNQGLTIDVYRNNMLNNQIQRLYDIKTNLHSVVSALTDKKEEQQITNQYDNVSNTYKNNIKQEYESSEGDLNKLEGQIKAENQSFKQNQSKVQQFESLISSFKVDSLPAVATISIINFKLGEDSSLPSQSSIDIDVAKFEIVFRVVRGCFTIVYWGIVLFLGYKITFFFVRFVRSNVLGIIPSTNKSDDGSFS